MTGFDLVCWHCGRRNFYLVVDEHGGTSITCEHHEEHVKEVAAEIGTEADEEVGS